MPFHYRYLKDFGFGLDRAEELASGGEGVADQFKFIPPPLEWDSIIRAGI